MTSNYSYTQERNHSKPVLSAFWNRPKIAWAVPENEIDLIIVPGVAFDRQRNRLGRGKGFYDRLLSTLNVPKIGISYDFQLKDQIPVEPFDRKMDLIITEKEII